jgi:predicted ATPase/class 3 adenylate cyclase
VSAYREVELIREGKNTIVSRAVRATDDTPVIIKQLRLLYPSPERIASFHRELDLTNLASSEGVIEAYGVEQHEGAVQLILEDFGATSLAQQASSRRFTLEELLDIAIAVSEALTVIHDRGIIHKDISPTNVVRNATTGQIKLIDFGISSRLRRASEQAQAPRALRATPAYMSPEQTGRMNVALDYRTDLYSLGATLYELLTGQLPFAMNDLLELVHAHIARVPGAPIELDGTIPKIVSDLVMRLLEKRAEDRYQSARSLSHDLEQCRERLADGRVSAFELGTRDSEGRFTIPQKLYGRRRETAMLLGAFQRVTTGGSEVLLVAGHSGIGKTTLVREVQRSILDCRGMFASGKCDQLNRGVPYASVAQAFRSLVRDALLEDEETQDRWREQIREAVGTNGRVITDLVGEVEQLIGPQPPLEEVSASDAENRMVHTVRQFVRAIAGPLNPLVLFVDDLQWADLPSLRLVESLARDFETTHVLFIGAYRDNEVDDKHPVTTILKEMRETSVVIREIELGPLAVGDICTLLSDTTSLPVSEVAPLAQLCADKTNGNPFYLNRFLEALCADQQIRFNASESKWQWDIERIAAQTVTENVLDFMCKKIETLDGATRQAVLVAAVAGESLDLRMLSLLLERTMRDVQADLRRALDEDLLRPVETSYWEAKEGDVPNFRLRFSHDRIQQAAYSLVPAEERHALHLRVGRSLLDNLPETERAQQLFDIVEHLHQAVELITGQEQRDELSHLLYEAGMRAMRAAAYAPAHGYLQRALAIGGDDVWTHEYDYAIDLSVEAARAAYLSGRHEAMDACIDDVLRHSKSALASSRALEIRILSLIGNQELGAAIDLALDILRDLGHPLVAQPTEEDVGKGLAATLELLGDRPNDTLAALPANEDDIVRATMQLEILISSAAFLSRPLLLPLLAFDLVKSSLTSGIDRQSAYGFGLFGLFLCAINQCAIASKQAELALLLLDRFGDRSLRPRPSHLVYGFIKCWTSPLRTTLEDEREVWFLGMDTGDIEYACWGLQLYLTNSFWAGKELEPLRAEYATYIPAFRDLKQEAAVHVSIQVQQAVDNLLGHASDPTKLIGEAYDEDEALAGYKATNYRGAIAVSFAVSLKLRYLFGDYAGAAAAAKEGAEYGDGVAATFMLVAFRFYGALAALKLCDQAGPEQREQLLELVAENRDALVVWRDFCPANHAHRIALLDAEHGRVVGDAVTAIDKYDEAIDLARANGFVQHEALANEHAARFYEQRGRRVVARAYMMEARFAYQRWGAVAKVAHLEEEFPAMLATASVTTTVSTTLGTTTTGPDPEVALDVQSLFKAATALASEIRLDALLDQVLDVAIQNAGATRGYLMLDHGNELLVEAAEDGEGKAICAKGTPVADAAGLSPAIVAHVLATGEPLVLDDVGADDRFGGDLGDESGSLLCAPVGYQGKRTGVVYLRNHLATSAFTPARLVVLEMLSTQAAIAIENARLYEQAREMAVSFERFVPKEFLAPLGRDRVVDLALGDAATHQITAMFVDLRGFTALFERLDPSDGYTLLNEYFSRMGPIIQRHQGIVIQFLGDGIMAAFMGAVDDAVNAVIDMARELRDMNEREVVTGAGNLELGAGLHSGQVMLATVGSAGRLDITAVGDTVNCTARIELATKALGAPILLSGEAMWRMMRPEDYDLRELGLVRVYGRSEPLELVEVFGADDEDVRAGKRETLAEFAAALASYRAGRHQDAADAFARCVERCPGDQVATTLLARARLGATEPSALSKGDIELV